MNMINVTKCTCNYKLSLQSHRLHYVHLNDVYICVYNDVHDVYILLRCIAICESDSQLVVLIIAYDYWLHT